MEVSVALGRSLCLAFGLVACGPSVEEACTDFVVAVEACDQENDGENPFIHAMNIDYWSGYCDALEEDLGGMSRSEVVQQLTCATEELESNGCSVGDVMLLPMLAFAECAPGAGVPGGATADLGRRR